MTPTPQLAFQRLRPRLGRVCVALAAPTADALLARAAVALRETSFLEFRLDSLPHPADDLPVLSRFLRDHPEVTIIATCRCQANGGAFRGSLPQALAILRAAASAGFPLVDLELEAAEVLPAGSVDSLRTAGAAVILSHHDFAATADLDAIFRRMEPFHPDIVKVVPTATRLADNLTLMRFLRSVEDRTDIGAVGICMGEAGVISRVLGLRAGSVFTFASASAGEETAPGQIDAHTLLETYRLADVDAATRIYGVAGDPIRSSLSPAMMNAAFRRETVNAVYLGLQTHDAADLFQLARELPVHGLSVTMPLKAEIRAYLERVDPLSERICAVNTVLRAQDGKFYGFNTDVAGIVTPLERRLALKGAQVLVLGAGGASRAAVFGCRDRGAEVFILNRTPETAAKLARQAGARAIRREAAAKTMWDVIINATPAGMAGDPSLPLLAADELNARWIFDLVYNPLETPLLRAARARGLAVISGVEMFLAQGARQFEIWTGKPAPLEEMSRVVLHALRQRESDVALPVPRAHEAPPPPTSPAPRPVAPVPAPKAQREKPAVTTKTVAGNAGRTSAAAKSTPSRTPAPTTAKPRAAPGQAAPRTPPPSNPKKASASARVTPAAKRTGTAKAAQPTPRVPVSKAPRPKSTAPPRRSSAR